MALRAARGSASTILRPALFADQWHERDGAKILFFEFRPALPGELYQSLIALFLAYRNHQTATDCELLFQRRRHLGSASRDHDCIERRGLWPTARAIADAQFDIVITELLQPLLGGFA
ncbi:hypothetical protein ACVWW3_004786 [Bradyrhizobium sp. LM2.9]